MSATLYEISADYQRALSFDLESEEDADALIGLLAEIEDRFETKAENVIKFIRNIEATGAMIRVEEVRLAERRRAMEKQAERLTDYLAAHMRFVGMNQVKAGIFEAKFKKNPPSVHIVSQEEIPERFYRQADPVLDRSLIKDALKAGQAVPGAELVQAERLDIK